MSEKAYVNTDREIWRECGGDYYSPSVHVTTENKIGINVGGYVIVKSAEEWHDLARPEPAPPASTEDLIANLVRRVHSLEQQLRDTQNNVERQGVEIANIEAVTKAPQSGAKLLAEAFEALVKYERSVGR